MWMTKDWFFQKMHCKESNVNNNHHQKGRQIYRNAIAPRTHRNNFPMCHKYFSGQVLYLILFHDVTTELEQNSQSMQREAFSRL